MGDFQYMKNSKEGNKRRYKTWYEKNKDSYRPKKAALMRKYRAKNPEKYRKQSLKYRQKLRTKLLEIYGDKCVLCGFNNLKALTLDHIDGKGNEERRKMTEWAIYRNARDNYQPEKYRTLCMNCQFIERSKSGSGCMGSVKPGGV